MSILIFVYFRIENLSVINTYGIQEQSAPSTTIVTSGQFLFQFIFTLNIIQCKEKL